MRGFWLAYIQVGYNSGEKKNFLKEADTAMRKLVLGDTGSSYISRVSNKLIKRAIYFRLDRSTGRAVWFLWVWVWESSARYGFCGSGYGSRPRGLVSVGLGMGVVRAVWFLWVWVWESSARYGFCGSGYGSRPRGMVFVTISSVPDDLRTILITNFVPKIDCLNSLM